MQTMSEVRSRITEDYESRYGTTFNISTVHVPDLPVPRTDILPGTAPGGAAPLEMYRGTDMFRNMTRYEKMRFDVGTEKVKSTINIRSIRQRYGYR